MIKKKTLKVVIIGGVSNFKMIKGGVESVVYNLSTQFSQHPDIEFYLLGNKLEKTSIGNVHFRNFPLPLKSIGLLLNILFFKKKILKIINQKYSPDIYHFQGTVPNLLLIDKSIQNISVVTQHAILREELKYQVNMLRKIKFSFKIFVEDIFFKRISNIIFISTYNYNYMLKRYNHTERIKYKLIFNPIHPIFFNRIETNYTKLKIYFVGELKKRKGFHDLLFALDILARKNIIINVEVIGDFNEEKYKTEIFSIIKDKQLGGNVNFNSWQTKEEIIEIAKTCQIFILPSYQETLPISIAEAMALGKVVIATDLPGIKEMIKDKKEGLLFAKGEVEVLAEKLELLYRNQYLIEELGCNARERAKYLFSPDLVLSKTINFYKSIIVEKNNEI